MSGGRTTTGRQDEAERIRFKEALEWIGTVQPGTVAMFRREGFKFGTPLHKPDAERTEAERWEKLAFTLYSTICEIDARVLDALDPDWTERL